MGVLKNPHWEKYAQLIAAGAPHKREAYRQARGDKLNSCRGDNHPLSDTALSQMATKILHRSDVQERIKELQLGIAKELGKTQAKIANKVELTLEKLLDEAEQHRIAAFKDKKYEAANSALTIKAKLSGLWVERSETTNAHYAISDEPMSRDEWKAEFVTGTQH